MLTESKTKILIHKELKNILTTSLLHLLLLKSIKQTHHEKKNYKQIHKHDEVIEI